MTSDNNNVEKLFFKFDVVHFRAYTPSSSVEGLMMKAAQSLLVRVPSGIVEKYKALGRCTLVSLY